MNAGPAERRRVLVLAAALLVVLGVWNNLVVNRLPGSTGSYVTANVTAAGVLVAAARATGLSWSELGLGRSGLAAGLRWGGGCAAVVASGYAVALVLPGLRPLLADERVAGRGGAEIAWQVLVRIPLGTVLWEEVAFRGVLLATLLRLLSPRGAVGVSAAVFGIWHVRPTLGALTANGLAEGPIERTLAVALACLATAGAGVLFAWLRLRSGSLLAPALLHLATNTLGTLSAAAAHRLG